MQTFTPRGRIHGPILPHFVLETSVSFGAKIMYALLCNYASDSDRCWPSQATLAARLSCSVSSVKKYLAELVEINLIHVRREQYRSSVYYLLQPAALKSASQEAKPTCRQSDSACVQPNSGCINTLNKQEERKTPPLPPVRSALPEVTASTLPSVLGGGGVRPEGREACPLASLRAVRASRAEMSLSDFEKAWELYPKKEAKGLARSAWRHLQREGQLPTLAQLESSIRHFMASETWQREQARFVPQMSNWLRGQRWLDAQCASFTVAVSVMAAGKETEAAQRAADALQAMQREEKTRKAKQDKEREALRPLFDAFAAKFQVHDTPWIRPMAFGLWLHLHNTHRAPSPSDVPADNRLGIADFLQAFKRRCEEAAWRQTAVPERAAQTVLGAFTVPRGSKLTALSALLPHHPVFSQQPVSPALARAM